MRHGLEGTRRHRRSKIARCADFRSYYRVWLALAPHRSLRLSFWRRSRSTAQPVAPEASRPGISHRRRSGRSRYRRRPVAPPVVLRRPPLSRAAVGRVRPPARRRRRGLADAARGGRPDGGVRRASRRRRSKANCRARRRDGRGRVDRPHGPLTAPPLVHGEWLLVASGEQVICYRVADGTKVWSRETGAVEQRAAVEGTRVYVPAADGRVIALELASGEPAWEFDIGIKPTEPLVYGGRLFVGSAGKRFCSLFLESGRKRRDDWCFQVGAAVIGRPAADATHVYFVALRQPAARARSQERRVSLEEGSALPAVGGSAARRRQHRGARERAARRTCSTRARGRRRFS